MSTRLKEKEEKILKILEQIAQEANKGTPIIVEGKKDAETLKELSINGRIIQAKSFGKKFLDVLSEAEKSDTDEVILLLDFDRRGKEWTKRLKENLERVKVKANLTLWRKLSRAVGGEVKDIEGLATYMENLKRKTMNSRRRMK
ncbi:toprim domain-containing protein [Candidatus Bathyarchaeota archaeon]|nr:MAG: toprim domain-containing protein [Candidatus Bathyarchaeota archaeon]